MTTWYYPPFLSRLYQQRWRVVFLLLATLLTAFGVQEGFEHAQVNRFRDQSVQLPILYSYADSELFQDDLILEARVSYVTWLYPVLGYLSRYFPLEIMMLILYVVSVGLTLSAVYSLAELFFPNRQVGIIAILLWAAWLPNPGGDFLRSAFPTHTTTAVGLQLWALVLGLRKQHLWAAILLGLSLNINAMTGVFISLVWGFDLLRERKWSWHLLQIPLIMGLMALPTLWWKFGISTASQDIPMEDFVGIIRTRLWYAVFPFSVDWHLWLSFALVVGIWVYASRYAPTETNRRVLWMVQGILILVFVGTVFTEIYPLELVIQLQLLRSTWVLNLFAMLYIANMIRELLWGSRRRFYLAILVTVLLAAPRVVIEFIPLPNPVPYTSYVDLNPVRAASPFWRGALGLLALTLSLAFAVWHLVPREDLFFSKRMLNWFVCAVLLFTAPVFIETAIPSEHVNVTQDWEQTLKWIRQNTSKDAAFITPPTLDGFRVQAERTHFTDWKDGTLLIFDDMLAEEWLDRMIALGFDEEAFVFHAPTQAQLCYIIANYDMDYAVVFGDWGIEGEAVYTNQTFAVLPTSTLNCLDG